MTGKNVVWHRTKVTRLMREKLNGHRSLVLWFTGLSASGKSTIAHDLEERLHLMGYRTYVFDGDNVRHGLCSDLGFAPRDREENIRRIGEMVRLFLDAGIIAITAFISPYRKDREWVKDLVGKENFIEIYCECPVDVCESRDVKGYYAKARRGEIPEFTGISSLYEAPENPDVCLKTADLSPQEGVNTIIKYLLEREIIRGNKT